MATFVQWVHVMSAVIGLGGLGYVLLVLLPALTVLPPEQRAALSDAATSRFRWATWSAMLLLLLSGIYNIRQYYWEVSWGKYWAVLTVKVALSFGLFAIILALTTPLGIFDRLRARRREWLIAAFALGVTIVLISAYLRRG